MRAPPASIAALLVAGLLTACGSAPPRTDPLLDETPMFPGEQPTLQMYLVLTDAPDAMQTDGAVEAMWDAVHGKDDRYRPIRSRVSGVPGGYALDVELDFADLPHPKLPAAALAPLIAQLPPAEKARAEKAALGISFRSTAGALPGGGQIRMVGAAVLFAARTHGGVVLDLLARRAWTVEAWAAELSADALSGKQVRVMRRKTDGGVMLLSRGHAKYGAPDLQMTGVAAGDLDAAQARFSAAQTALFERGGAPGGQIIVKGERVRLAACEGVVIEVACVRIAP